MKKKLSEYDQRQLKLMLNNLFCFEKNEINLDSLIGVLEFLLNAMEIVEETWEDKFLKEITTLESINAINIIKEAGEEVAQINKNQANDLIKNAVSSLILLIENELENNG